MNGLDVTIDKEWLWFARKKYSRINGSISNMFQSDELESNSYIPVQKINTAMYRPIRS